MSENISNFESKNLFENIYKIGIIFFNMKNYNLQ